MNLVVIGSVGRENEICYKLKTKTILQSKKNKLYTNQFYRSKNNRKYKKR